MATSSPELPANDIVPTRRWWGRLLDAFGSGFRHRDLILLIVRREIKQRYQESMLGWIWAIVAPLVLLVTYTVVFSGPLKLPGQSHQGGTTGLALFFFSGLIVFNFFVELTTRAPSLLREHAWFLKRTIFPGQVLAWVALLRALFSLGIGFALLITFQILLSGRLPLTIVLAPIVIAPMCLFLVGLTWHLAALGALTQDVSQVMAAIIPALLFASPIFYDMSQIPEAFRPFAYLNPLCTYVEMFREVSIFGTLPSLSMLALSAAISLAFFFTGHAVFMRYRRLLVDVI